MQLAFTFLIGFPVFIEINRLANLTQINLVLCEWLALTIRFFPLNIKWQEDVKFKDQL